MRHWPAHLLLTLITGTLPAVAWSAPSWQIVPGQWSGALELGFDHSGQSSQSAGGGASSSGQRFRETLRVANRGFYLLDPRLVNASLGLQINLNQARDSGAGAGTRSAGTVIGYNFNASILETKPYPVTLYANRNQSQSVQSFGGRVEGITENRGISVRLEENSMLKDWIGPWFSAELRARQEHAQDTTTFFDRVSRRDEMRRTVDIMARKGFTTADLGFRYQMSEQSNRLLAQAGNRSQNADLYYSLDFGPGLNRHFDSSLSYATRGGLTPTSVVAADGHLRLDHYRNLSTDYSYGFNRQQTQGLNADRHSGSVSLTHELYQNLTTTASVSGSRYIVPAGLLTSYGGQLNQNYRHSLPGNGRLNMNWSGGYRLDTSQLSVGLIGVNREKHTASTAFAPGVGFFLDNAFAVISSISVVNVRAGASIPTTAGIDYEIVEEGKRVRIEPKFGSVLIAPNDPLEVGYDYQVDPSLKYETQSSGFGAGVDYRWIAVSFQHRQSAQKPLAGEGRFLTSTSSDTVRLDLRGTWQDLETEASASHSRSTSTMFLDEQRENRTQFDLRGGWHEFDGQGSAVFDQYRATLLAYDRRSLVSTLTWRARHDLNLVFSANASDVHYLTPERQDATRSARASLNWNESGGWTHTAFAEVRIHNDGVAATDTVMQLGARTRWQLGKLSLVAGLAFDRWARGGTRSNSQRFDISIVRAF